MGLHKLLERKQKAPCGTEPTEAQAGIARRRGPQAPAQQLPYVCSLSGPQSNLRQSRPAWLSCRAPRTARLLALWPGAPGSYRGQCGEVEASI